MLNGSRFAFAERELITAVLCETGREASEQAREAPVCVLVEGWLEWSWCETLCGVGAKREAMHQRGFL